MEKFNLYQIKNFAKSVNLEISQESSQRKKTEIIKAWIPLLMRESLNLV